ncbi:hypothetical protein [Jidongwangia harbinensis]|uniref:hypothetical protein n=1 Tax=Jidongwangia harbinensis TaxID=2878561 RepID=UPI001CD9D8B3|nr:hypothetical protein [Jidongwangia harbinensis]MCA2216125.1 hypothetical protein [Jidongwangia harbinensis]
MTIDLATDLGKKVERYVSALEELRAAHKDVKEVLLGQVLFERWEHLGAELGFEAAPRQNPPDPDAGRPQRDLAAMNHQISEMSDSWAS